MPHHIKNDIHRFWNHDPKGIAMINASKSRLSRTVNAASAWSIFLGVVLRLGTTASVYAQGQIASGIVSGSGTGPYGYSLTFSDAANATAPIGSVWYAWVPGGFFLPSTPTSASAPVGWTATISSTSIQYVANSAANDITAGHSLSGFGYQATFSPSQLAAAPNSGESVAYSAGLFSDTGNTFTVQAAVPEPSTAMFFIPCLIGWYVLHRRSLKVAGSGQLQ